MKKHEEKKDPKIEELENQLKRVLADYQNLEKRQVEEKRNWIKSANKDLILKILPTLDHLESILKTGMDNVKGGEEFNWLKGVEMVVKQFRDVLKEEGLEPVQTNHFDPQLHEVVEVREGPEGEILDVLSMGYKLNDKLIKPARVVVGKESIEEKAENVVKQEEQRGDYV